MAVKLCEWRCQSRTAHNFLGHSAGYSQPGKKETQQGLECFQEKNDIMEIKTIGKIYENPTQHSTDAPSEGGKTTAEEDNNSNVLVCTGK